MPKKGGGFLLKQRIVFISDCTTFSIWKEFDGIPVLRPQQNIVENYSVNNSPAWRRWLATSLTEQVHMCTCISPAHLEIKTKTEIQ